MFNRVFRIASFLTLAFSLGVVCASAPAVAGDCWGCHAYACMQGFDAGGLFCEETHASCGFLYKLLGIHCDIRTCRTSEACPRSIGTPDGSVDPSRTGGGHGDSTADPGGLAR